LKDLLQGALSKRKTRSQQLKQRLTPRGSETTTPYLFGAQQKGRLEGGLSVLFNAGR